MEVKFVGVPAGLNREIWMVSRYPCRVPGAGQGKGLEPIWGDFKKSFRGKPAGVSCGSSAMINVETVVTTTGVVQLAKEGNDLLVRPSNGGQFETVTNDPSPVRNPVNTVRV